MQWLKDFIGSFFEWLWKGFLWLAEAVGEVISFLLFTIYDGLLTVLHTFAAAVDLSAVAFNMAAQYSNLPSTAIWLINQINIPQGLTYIAGAILIRMIINLIPAAATRV